MEQSSRFNKLDSSGVQDRGFSACQSLQFIRGLQGFTDTSPSTVFVRGNRWPNFQEVVTRYPLCGSSELLYLVGCIQGQSTLSFGLIVPDNRRNHLVGLQYGEDQKLRGTLWAWNSKSRQIFRKPFDSRHCAGASSKIVCYDCDVTSGSLLSVRRDPENKRIYFNINGKEAWVSIGGYAQSICYGYARLTSIGNDSEIEVTLIRGKAKEAGLFQQNSPSLEEVAFVHENSESCWKPVVRGLKRLLIDFPGKTKAFNEEPQEDVPQLCHYELNQRPQGICLIINNASSLNLAEEVQLSNLLSSFAFDVHIRQNLTMLEINRVAQEFAAKDHSNYGVFVFFVISVGSHDHEISGIDGRKASVEQVMSEFTSGNCPSLQNKPKLFFVQRFTMSPSKLEESHDSSLFLPYCDGEAESKFSPQNSAGWDVCPEEADFLLACACSETNKAQQIPESSFIQVLAMVFTSYCHLGYDLLELLTKVNELLVIEANRASLVQVPYLTHTLRAKLYLGSTLNPTQETASFIPGPPQLNRYEINRTPHGYCIIINNLTFEDENLSDRHGASKDVDSLKKLFTDLKFTVVIKKDLDKHEIERVAENFAKKDHREFGAFFFILMSHGGNRDCILGVQGRKTSVENLMVEFQARNCPSLKGKPKVFIIQTCRGVRECINETFVSPVGSIQSQDVLSTSPSSDAQSTGCPSTADSTLARSVFPTEADFLLAFATVPSFVSFRFKEFGTIFIQALVEVIREHHHHHHFLDILTEVTKRVVERQTPEHNIKCRVQVPAPMHTLTKNLYL